MEAAPRSGLLFGRFQVLDDPHGELEWLGGAFQRREGVLVTIGASSTDGAEGLSSSCQQYGDAGNDVGRLDAVEGDREGEFFEQGRHG